ncbi:MAG: hypothetical protein M5U22_20495 [Thermoleophilia bacterium]|nr:hypothetical protein [Thermoleophilia bacterium]
MARAMIKAAILIVLALLLIGFSADAFARPETSEPAPAAAFAAGGEVDALAPEIADLLAATGHRALECAACHSGERLEENACLECHTGAGPAAQVYGGRREIYLGDDPDHGAHVARHGATMYRGCLSCHEPHGVSVVPGSKLLRDDPAKGVVSRESVDVGGEQGFGSITFPVTNQRDFCLDCHGGLTRYTSTGQSRLSREEFHQVFSECAQCHPNRDHFGVDADPEPGGPSHVMIADAGSGSAWRPSAFPREGVDKQSNSCTLCHDSLQDFPHYSPDSFSIEGYDSGEDELCARCHTDTGSFATANEGVGITY